MSAGSGGSIRGLVSGALAKPDPCSEYKELDEAYRSTSFEMNHNHRGKCDAGLRRGWYRFTSTAGGVMPESCVQRFKVSCVHG